MNMNQIGKYVIIRTERAGVFAGTLAEKNGNEVSLTNARRLWYWSGAASLSQLAVDGVNNARQCKFTVTVDEIELLGVIEIITCTTEAEVNIKAVAEWKA